MCIDSDLFNDVIVTIKDVDIWLDVIAKMQGCAQSRREHYAEFFDVANKIKEYKLRGLFDNVISQHEANYNGNYQSIKLFNTQYVKPILIDEKKPDCPIWFHICDNKLCPVYVKNCKHTKTHARYVKSKFKH